MKSRNRLFALLFVLMVLILIFIHEWERFMEMPVHFLEKWERLPPHSDAVFILLGDSGHRALYASRLLKEGYADRVAMGKIEKESIATFGLVPDESAIACTVLIRSGIPPNTIHVTSIVVSSTLEEAQAARKWAAETGIDSLIFVTSSYHSARTSWILKRVFDSSDIHRSIAVVPVPEIDWRPWWETEDGMVTIFNECVKFLYYNLNYREYHD